MTARKTALAASVAALAALVALAVVESVEGSQNGVQHVYGPSSDLVLDPGAWARVGTDNGGPEAYRPGASDIPRSYPLLSTQRDAVHSA